MTILRRKLNRRLLSVVIAILPLSQLSTLARADFINTTNADSAPTIAKISITDRQIRLDLEISAESRSAFASLIPDAWPDNPDPISTIQKRDIDDFSHRIFRLEVNGKALEARLVSAKAAERSTLPSRSGNRYDPLTGTLLPTVPVDTRVYALDFMYDLNEKPQLLTIVPPMAGGAVLANIGFSVDHQGMAINDFDYLSGPEPIELHWQDPWYSRFENPNIARRFKYPFMSFLYIEPFEIRHEILVRFKDLERFLGADMAGKPIEDALPKISHFFRGNTFVKADGNAIPIDSETINFVAIDRTTMQTLKKGALIDKNAAILGIIFVYNIKNFPANITLDWNIFDARLKEVPAVISDPAGNYTFAMNAADHTLTWRNARNFSTSSELDGIRSYSQISLLLPYFLTIAAMAILGVLIWRTVGSRRGRIVATVALITAGAGMIYHLGQKTEGAMDHADNKQLFAALLKNMYRAFDFRGEIEVYDKLARTLSEGILADVYLAQRQALVIEKAGGATAKVQSIDVKSVEPANRKGSLPSFHVVWDVTGTVGHWGHVHVRTNRYDAMIRLKTIDGYWKIDGLDVLSEDRLQ